MNTQKTHFADDDTLARLIRLERLHDAVKNYWSRLPDTNYSDSKAVKDALIDLDAAPRIQK